MKVGEPNRVRADYESCETLTLTVLRIACRTSLQLRRQRQQRRPRNEPSDALCPILIEASTWPCIWVFLTLTHPLFSQKKWQPRSEMIIADPALIIEKILHTCLRQTRCINFACIRLSAGATTDQDVPSDHGLRLLDKSRSRGKICGQRQRDQSGKGHFRRKNYH